MFKFKQKPLIFYTFNALKKLDFISNSFLSSDDDRIIDYSKRFNINTLFKRPSYLSSSKSKTIDVIKHFLKKLEEINISYKYIVILQPSSPLRKSKTIYSACMMMQKYDYNSLISVSELPFNYKHLAQPKNNIITNMSVNKALKNNDKKYFINGAIYIYKIKFIKDKKSMYFKKNNIFKMPFSESVDIDTIEDLKLAERLC